MTRMCTLTGYCTSDILETPEDLRLCLQSTPPDRGRGLLTVNHSSDTRSLHRELECHPCTGTMYPPKRKGDLPDAQGITARR